MDIKVATVIRVAVRGSVVRVRVRKAIVSTIVPIATETDGADDVGINEVSIASSIPYNYKFQNYEGKTPLCLRQIHPLLIDAKVATVIRGAGRGSVERVRERKASVSTSAPKATETDGADDVGKNEVSIVCIVSAR